ncbi:MAG: type IV toxin-antitoxin system AbiEi family antitoxin domain-containing protein [Thermoleophilaceae bacterium]|jgi:predicted transcriptional regulator of viral defense system
MPDNATRPDHSGLDRLAYAQEGYFTSGQAAEMGFSAQLLAHHAHDGRFERVRRGLYRLRDYPTAPHEATREAWLAIKDRAVVSHESALELHGLSDVIADRIHLTVPREARGTRVRPGVALHTTTTPLSSADVTRRHGLLVSSPARTIVDAAAAGTAPEQIEAAIEQALREGMTTAGQLRRVAAGADRRVADLIDRTLRAQPSGA